MLFRSGFSVETLVVGPIEENCYVLKDEETGHGLIMASGQNSKFSIGFSVNWNPKTAYSHSHTASSGLRTR